MKLRGIEVLLLAKTPDNLRQHWFDDQDKFVSLNARNIRKTLASIAAESPDTYPDLVESMARAGLDEVYRSGTTLGLEDFHTPFDKDVVIGEMRQELSALKGLPANEAATARDGIHAAYASKLSDLTEKYGRASGNRLVSIVDSGARGSMTQLRSLITAPGTLTDYKGDQLPIFIERGYHQGISPVDFLATSYGTRSAIISGKKSTAIGGDIAKMLQSATASIVVSEKDCGTTNGIDLPVSEESVAGRIIARGNGAGEQLGVRDLASMPPDSQVVVRSPMTCQSKHGICQKCLGASATGQLYPIGHHAGSTASNATGEPLAQGALRSKHESGVGSKKNTFSGLGVIQQLLQSPERFPHKAAVAPASGIIEDVTPAPQGGNNIRLGEHTLYVPPGLSVFYTKGDEVDPGTVLSEGLVDTEDVIAAAGIGAGRETMIAQLGDVLKDSGAKTDRRHLEVLARSTVDFLGYDGNEPMDGVFPGDTVRYSRWARNYTPPKETQFVPADKAVGKYLEQPALHYSIKTPVTASIATRLKKAGFDTVAVSDVAAADFHPQFVRLRTPYESNEDWLVSQTGSYIKSRLQSSATRGTDSPLQASEHWVPSLARGNEFGREVRTTGKF